MLRFKPEKLDELRRISGVKSKKEFARLLDIDYATLWRVTDGGAAPSSLVIERVKVAFPTVSFDELIEVAA